MYHQRQSLTIILRTSSRMMRRSFSSSCRARTTPPPYRKYSTKYLMNSIFLKTCMYTPTHKYTHTHTHIIHAIHTPFTRNVDHSCATHAIHMSFTRIYLLFITGTRLPNSRRPWMLLRLNSRFCKIICVLITFFKILYLLIYF
jgi:hypothetical protein